VVLPGNGGTMTSTYDPLEQRIRKSFIQNMIPSIVGYLYDGDNIIEEVDGNGIAVARNLYR
jgi:hypothetical protein